MKVAKKEDFALILMKNLAKFYPEGYVSLSFIAKKEKLSPLFLKHIAKKLLEKNLIISKEGINGGYRLKKAPQDISLGEVIKAISEKFISPSCLRGASCHRKKSLCSCFHLWNRLNKNFYLYLKKITLADFIRF